MTRLVVQHNSVETFQADAVAVLGNVYNFTDNTPPPPQNIQTSGTVQWNAGGSAWPGRVVDMTDLSQIIGRFTPNDPVLPWPGRSGSTSRFIILPNHIIAARFIVPADVNANDNFGIGGNSYTAGNPPLAPYPPAGQRIKAIFCLSQTPGDFSRPGPYTVRAPINSDAAFLHYTGGATTAFYAGITPGLWYLNICGFNPTTGQIDLSQPVGIPFVHTGRINPN